MTDTIKEEPRKKRYKARQIRKSTPKWYVHTKSLVNKAKVKNITDLMLYWASTVNKENKEDWVKSMQPMTLKQACRQAHLPVYSFHYQLSTNPELKKGYELFKENRREGMKNKAEENLNQLLDWGLEGKELADLSIKLLERTDRAYNQKVEIEQTTKNLNFNIPIQDLEKQLKDILNLWKN